MYKKVSLSFLKFLLDNRHKITETAIETNIDIGNPKKNINEKLTQDVVSSKDKDTSDGWIKRYNQSLKWWQCYKKVNKTHIENCVNKRVLRNEVGFELAIDVDCLEKTIKDIEDLKWKKRIMCINIIAVIVSVIGAYDKIKHILISLISLL